MVMTRKRYEYVCKNSAEQVEIITWCRNAFGQRGIGWDFVPRLSKKYGNKGVTIEIWDDRLDVMWLMWKE